MFPSPILTIYISRQFSVAVASVLAALTGLVSLFDFLELLRRSASRPDATFNLIVEMALLRTPWVVMTILPFAILLGGIWAFWRLTRSSELVVARAAGLSAWQFLGGPVLCALALGLFAVGGLSPVSAALFAQAERLQESFLDAGGGPLALNGGQLWLRQADNTGSVQGVAIMHARGVMMRANVLTASQVSIFRLGPNDHMIDRIEAMQARLIPHSWLLANARVLVPGKLPSPPSAMAMPTDLTIDRIQQSFAAPEALSFWRLPGFIHVLERAGFSAVGHRLRFQALLALPLLCATMSLVAAGFSMQSSRRGGVGRMIGGGVAAGFALFMLSNIAEQFGQSGALPVVLAAWAPAAAGLMLALSLLLHLEDG
ncbi:LPS export ABC transporter permease LptG [Acidisoma sp. S159]|uniref:LPS export ABC transporter permease LptG n=1 Tax=Acidisoma sp. S159 TaxID=1747225 RepID=UPI00131CE86D|nr:LPS export ABC transporter permease LptG [Acidisoma sp. S159]